LLTIAHASSERCGELMTIAVQSGPANSNEVFRVGGIERLVGDVAISARILIRVEIAQFHVDPKGRKPLAERAVTAAWIERNSRQIQS
jgi:hypothetical protein